MKIYSWNMYCLNKQEDEAFEFIKNLDYDVLCLQEVPARFLERLKTLKTHIASAVDCERFNDNRLRKQYVVILSKYKLQKPEAIAFRDIKHPVRTKVVIRMMRTAGWTPTRNRNAIRAMVKVGATTYQVFCVHFTLSSPASRAREFATILDHTNHSPVIIAGDFNVLEHPSVKPFSWFLGSTIKEALPTYPERKLFEERFNNAKLQNPLLGHVTHDFSSSQLDHIVVSDSLSVKEKGVHNGLYGSDHYPVYIRL